MGRGGDNGAGGRPLALEDVAQDAQRPLVDPLAQRARHVRLQQAAQLADFRAAHGFVAIQPTHLDSSTVSVDRNGPEGPLFWRSRVEDTKRILDQIDLIQAAVPALSGRLDRSRIAAAGYSLGGHTAAMLLGMRTTDPDDGTEVDLVDARIKAGVLLAAPGRGSDPTE